eukprot:g1384.t1
MATNPMVIDHPGVISAIDNLLQLVSDPQGSNESNTGSTSSKEGHADHHSQERGKESSNPYVASFVTKLRSTLEFLERVILIFAPRGVEKELYKQQQQQQQLSNASVQQSNASVQPVIAPLLRRLSFSFNGGKDSTVVLYLLIYVCHKLQCSFQDTILSFYFPSSQGFPEEASFVNNILKSTITGEPTSKTPTTLFATNNEDQTSPNLGQTPPNLGQAPPNLGQAPPNLLSFPEGTGYRKGLETLTEVHNVSCVFMGTRSTDPDGKSQTKLEPSSLGWPAFMRINPILDWTYQDVWYFLLRGSLPYCSLYNRGYTSIGYRYNTQKNPGLQKEAFIAKLLLEGQIKRERRADITAAITKIESDKDSNNTSLRAVRSFLAEHYPGVTSNCQHDSLLISAISDANSFLPAFMLLDIDGKTERAGRVHKKK